MSSFYLCSKPFIRDTSATVRCPLLSSTLGCLRSFRRGLYPSSPHLWSSFRCWAQLCSERHCPSLARNWTTTRRTSVSWTAMLLLCCSHRWPVMHMLCSASFVFILSCMWDSKRLFVVERWKERWFQLKGSSFVIYGVFGFLIVFWAYFLLSRPNHRLSPTWTLKQAGSRADLSSLCAQLLRTLESRQSEGPAHCLTHTLPILNTVLTHSPESLTEGNRQDCGKAQTEGWNGRLIGDQALVQRGRFPHCSLSLHLSAADHVTLLSKKLVDWLRYASITQGGGASSGGFFTGPRSRQVNITLSFCGDLRLSHIFWVRLEYRKHWTNKESVNKYICVLCFFCQPAPIAELDGTVSGDFFTVLCVGQGFTDDQWMNVYSFSMLRHWLLTYHSVANGNTTADTGMTSPIHANHNLLLSHARESHYSMSYLQKVTPASMCVRRRLLIRSISHLRWPALCFHHLQQTGCSSASPTPTPFLMVRYVRFVDAPCMPLRCWE